MRFQMLNNAHPPGWALFVLCGSWAATCRLGLASWSKGEVSRTLRRVPEPVSARWTECGIRTGVSASAPPPPLASPVPSSSPALCCSSCASASLPGCLPPSVVPSPVLGVVGHEVVVMGCWGQRDLGCQDGWC